MVVNTNVKIKSFAADVSTGYPTECSLEFDLAAKEKQDNIAEIQALFGILKQGAVIRVTFHDGVVEPFNIDMESSQGISLETMGSHETNPFTDRQKAADEMRGPDG